MKQKRIVIIGGGPAGTSAAMAFAMRHADVTLVEKDRIGGVCVSSGCVPTRVYLQAIKQAEAMRLLDDSLSDYKIPTYKLRTSANRKIEQVSFGTEYMLRKLKVNIVYGEAKVTGEFTAEVNGEEFAFDELVLASGSEPFRPSGISFEREFSVEHLMTLTDLPRSLSIIGGGIMGIEMAVILNYFGVSVTIYERESSILPEWDEDLQFVMTGYLKHLGIAVVTDSAENVFKDVVFCCGRVAEPELQGEHIHYIGDAAGRFFTADMAMEEGTRLAEQLQNRTEENVKSGSACIFTPLEAASTGLTAKDEEGLSESYLEIGYYGTGRIFDLESGFVKAVMDKETHVLKGFHVVSALASEIIQIGQMAVEQCMTAEEFCKTVFPHPTEGELLKEAVKKLL